MIIILMSSPAVRPGARRVCFGWRPAASSSPPHAADEIESELAEAFLIFLARRSPETDALKAITVYGEIENGKNE